MAGEELFQFGALDLPLAGSGKVVSSADTQDPSLHLCDARSGGDERSTEKCAA